MTKLLTTLVTLSTIGFASSYYAKVEPLSTYNVKSAVTGKITYVNKDKESKTVQSDVIVKIEDIISKTDLKQSKIKLANLNEVLEIEKNTLKSFSRVSSKSKFDKDNQKIKILNIESSVSDLKTKIATLEDQVKNKTLTQKDTYLYNIAVEIGDYVNPGTLLYTSMDLSGSKLTIFIPIADAKSINEKTIYIDDKLTNLKISKLYSVADSKHISSYKCEIIVKDQSDFSKLLKVEFK